MKKKNVEKLINKIDIDNNFDKINSQINYGKYLTKKEVKNKMNSTAKVFIIAGALYASIIAFFAILLVHLCIIKKFMLCMKI